MPRPIKCRKVSFIPETTRFTAENEKELEEITLKLEELEAMRLKDIEKLNQEECAKVMGVSRQTFQNIIDKAREKVAIALTEGRQIEIRGGNYILRECKRKCLSCDEVYNIKFEKDKRKCPKCGSEEVRCNNKKSCCSM